jgi:hypothetical protein
VRPQVGVFRTASRDTKPGATRSTLLSGIWRVTMRSAVRNLTLGGCRSQTLHRSLHQR